MKISIYQRNKIDADGKMPVFIVINHASKKSLISTGIKTSYPVIKTSGIGIGIVLDKREPSGRLKLKRIEAIYSKVEEYCLEHTGMRVAAIKKALAAVLEPKERGALYETMMEYAGSEHLTKSTSAIIVRTAKKVEEFDPSAGFGIDESWLRSFESWLKGQDAKVNGIGIHLRNIRTVFNYARRKGLTKEYPFLDYRIKEERQTIRNMSLEQVREFKDYPCEPWQVEYRDIFMLMVYLGGINIGDLLMCKGLVNGRLVYKRAKTDKPISLYVCPQALEIIEKYKGKDYLISPMDRYSDKYGYVGRINDGLKKIGKLEIGKDKVGRMRKHKVTPFFSGITTYVARYTFASVAADIGIERDVIAACLGHSWADVTSHYVAYSQQKMDEAVKKVADAISTK